MTSRWVLVVRRAPGARRLRAVAPQPPPPGAAAGGGRHPRRIVPTLAEGGRRHGRDPGRFGDMAHGSAGEIRGALDLAVGGGWRVESTQARALLDRELGLLWGLTRRGRAK